MPEQGNRFLEAEEQAERLVQMLAELRKQAVSYQDAGGQLTATRERLVSLLQSMEQLSKDSRNAIGTLAQIAGGEMLERIAKTLELSGEIHSGVGKLQEQTDELSNVHFADLSARIRKLTLLVWVTLGLGTAGIVLSIVNLLT